MNYFCLVSDAFGGGGGIAQYNRDLLAALCALPDTASVVALPRQGLGGAVPAKLRQLRPRQGRFSYAWHALREALRLRPDVVFCGHIHFYPLAALIGAWLRRPVWLQIHGIDAWRPPSDLVRRWISHAALVTSVSRHTRRRFLSWAELPAWRVKVLPNTVSERYRPVDRDAARARWEVGDRRVLLTVGRLASSEAYKGHDRILRCLPGLREQYPELVYLVAGAGDDRGRLEALGAALGVTDLVRFLGAVDHDELPGLYAAADVFAMPSTGEGFGIVFLEAMACGTPTVALDEDGSRDPLRDGDLGRLCGRDGLCDALRQALAERRPVDLAERVLACFGRDRFGAQLAHIVAAVFPRRIGAGA